MNDIEQIDAMMYAAEMHQRRHESEIARRTKMETRYVVRDRLTGKIVFSSYTDDARRAHESAEKWCRNNLGDRGEIVEIHDGENQ